MGSLFKVLFAADKKAKFNQDYIMYFQKLKNLKILSIFFSRKGGFSEGIYKSLNCNKI